MELIAKLQHAVDIKPKFGEVCNNCGYCCLTEVCPVGQDLTGKTIGPCELLVEKDDKHYCKLVLNNVDIDVGAGTGCCAETQQEVITRLTT